MMSFRKLRPLEWIQKCWMHLYCLLVKEIMKWAEIFTGWFYHISLDSCKVWKHLQTLYQCCAWALKFKIKTNTEAQTQIFSPICLKRSLLYFFCLLSILYMDRNGKLYLDLTNRNCFSFAKWYCHERSVFLREKGYKRPNVTVMMKIGVFYVICQGIFG